MIDDDSKLVDYVVADAMSTDGVKKAIETAAHTIASAIVKWFIDGAVARITTRKTEMPPTDDN